MHRHAIQSMNGTKTIGVWGLNLATILTAAALCRANEALLSEDRWHEHSFGVSMRVPTDARLYERVIDDAVPWTLGGSDGTRQAMFQSLGQPFHLDLVRNRMLRELVNDPNHLESDRQLLRALQSRKSIGPTRKAMLLAHNMDDSLLLIESDSSYSIRFYLRTSTKGLHINKIAAHAINDVGLRWPSAIIETERQIEPAQRAGALFYYKIPDRRRGDRSHGQALIQVDDYTFALLRLDAPYAVRDHAQVAFEAMIDSITIESSDTLLEQRRHNVERGRTWWQAKKLEERLAAIQPVQLLRIIQADSDIGYMTVEMRPGKELGLDGLAVIVQAREYEDEHVHDTKGRFFLSNDLNHEIWDIRTTTQQRDHGLQEVGAPNKITWAETGTRNRRIIKVTRSGLSGRKELQWELNPETYLSQVDLHLLNQMLPEEAQEMGFYAYLPSANKLTYRSVRIEPIRDGYRVFTRASPDRPESLSKYDKNGQFQGRWLVGGRAVLPTTNEQFKRIWNFTGFP